MHSRIFAFLLAIALSWSGLAVAAEGFAGSMQGAEQCHAHEIGGSEPRDRGGFGDGPMDDQPIQSHAEYVSDLPALLDTPNEGNGAAVGTVCPPQLADVILLPLYLEGLKRPPRSASTLSS